MSAMVPMHEQMHEGAGEQQTTQDKTVPGDMCAVVEDKQQRADG
jgi:hypothetical protein